MKINNKLIVGSSFSLAALLVAIDHTRHPVPEATSKAPVFSAFTPSSSENPCSLDLSPCALNNAAPCSLSGESANTDCAKDDLSPCAL